MARKYDNSKAWAKSHRINESGVVERLCSTCKEWLEENEDNFYLHNKNKPEKGFQSECKKCSIIRSQSIAERMSPEKKELLRIERKERYKKDKEIEIKRQRDWYQNNKNRKRLYLKEYFIKNPEKAKLYSFNHRNHDITTKEWLACLKFFDNKCAYCGMTLEEHLQKHRQKLHKEHADHEGHNDIRNCVPACRTCNDRKWAFPLEGWYKEQEFFSEEKLDKIYKWCTEEYKKYIEPKPPYRITKKQNDDKCTYHFELWSIDEKRNMIERIAVADKKKHLKKDIEKYLKLLESQEK